MTMTSASRNLTQAWAKLLKEKERKTATLTKKYLLEERNRKGSHRNKEKCLWKCQDLTTDLNQPGAREYQQVSNTRSQSLRMASKLIKERVANSSNNPKPSWSNLKITSLTLLSSSRLHLTNLTLKSLQDPNKRASQTTWLTTLICNSLVKRSKS